MSFSRANLAGWSVNDELTSAQANIIDTNQSLAIDGSAGGAYAPSSAIVVGNAGMRVASGSTWHVLSGGFFQVDSGGTITLAGQTTVTSGGVILFNNGSGITNHGTFVNSTSSVTQFISGSTVTTTAGVTFNMGSVMSVVGAGEIDIPGSQIQITDHTYPTFTASLFKEWVQPNTIGFVQGITRATLDALVLSTGASDSVELFLDKVHDGSTLISVSVTVLGQTHSGSVATQATIDLRRIRLVDGNNVSMFSTGPQSLNAQMSSSSRTQVPYTVDQNNVIDKSTYYYIAIVRPESGTNSLSAFLFPLKLGHTVLNLKFH